MPLSIYPATCPLSVCTNVDPAEESSSEDPEVLSFDPHAAAKSADVIMIVSLFSVISRALRDYQYKVRQMLSLLLSRAYV